MGRQQLRQILAPALFASAFLLLSYNEKLILLTTPLTAVFINRHIFSFAFADANTLPANVVTFLSPSSSF